MKKNTIEAQKFDEAFDNGEDISQYLDLDSAHRPGRKQKRVSVDFPEWMVQELDRVSQRLGITRQSVIKVYISEKLKEESR